MYRNFVRTLTYLGITILYCSDCASSSKLQEDLKQLELPNVDIGRLDASRQKIVQQLQSFASEYTRRAYEVSKLSGKEKLRAGKSLEEDFMKNFQRLEFQIRQLQRGPNISGGLRSNLTYQRSIMTDLYSFLRAIFELPMKIHCLIFGCPDGKRTSSTASTTSTTPAPITTTTATTETTDDF